VGEDDDRVASSERRFAVDEAGTRRMVGAGDRLPDGWRVEQPEPEPEPPKPKRQVPKGKA